jgi:hypothetical protein
MNFECQISIYILKQTSFDVYVYLNKIAKKMNVHYIKRKSSMFTYPTRFCRFYELASIRKKERKSFTLLIANR